MMLLILNILIVSAYVALSVYATNGIPVSLSATYYTLGKDGWMFQAVMAFVGVTLYPEWVESTEHEWTAFMACSSLLFVASAPCFRLPLQGIVHYSSAVICCVSAVAWQILEGLWDVTLLFGWLSLMLSLMWRDKYMWFVECAVIGSLFSNLLRVL